MLLVVGGYGLLSLLFTWPLALHFNSAVLGGRVASQDHGLYIWQLWWFQYALRHGLSPFMNPMVYYPEPVQFYVQPFHPAASVLVAPVLFLFGPYAAYNTSALLSFALSGVGMFALLRFVAVRPALAFLGGVLFAFSPFHAVKYADGHLNLMQTQWVPLYVLALLWSITRPSWQSVGAAIVFAALTVLSDLYWALYSALFSGLFLGLLLLQLSSWHAARRVLLLPVLIGGGLVLVLLPFLFGALEHVSEGGRSGLALSIRLYSADLLDFVTPNLLHPLWGQAALEWGGRWHPYSAGGNVGLGVVLLAASGVALMLELRRLVFDRGYDSLRPAFPFPFSAFLAPGFWLALLFGMLLISLGPELKIAGVATGIPLPYALIERLPGASVGRKPNHAVLHVILCAIVVAALLGERLLRSYRPWGPPVLMLATLIALVEIVPPRWQIFPELPQVPFFADLAAAPLKEALLNLPNDSHTSIYLRQATQHEWPIVGGSISRKPYDWFSAFAPGVRQLTNARLDPPDVLDPPVDQIAAVSLDAYRLRYIVLHRDSSELPPAYLERVEPLLRAWLGPAARIAREGAMDIYQVPRQPNPPPFAYFREGWYGVESQAGRRWRWSEGRAEVVLVNPRPSDLPVTLIIEGQGLAATTQLHLTLDGIELTTLNMPQQHSSIRLRLLLEPGQNLLVLNTPPVLSQEKSPRPLGIAITRLRISAD